MRLKQFSSLLGVALLCFTLPILASGGQDASKGVARVAAMPDMGEVRVNSALGEPLDAEIELVAIAKVERGSLIAHLASPELFKSMGVSYPGRLPKLEFRVETRTSGELYIKVTSAEPVNEPAINLLVQLNGSFGRLIREYTLSPNPVAGKTAGASATVSPEAGARETHPSPAPASASQPTSGNTALVRIDRFDVKGNTLLDAGLIERLLAPFKGEARSYTDIQLALEALEGAYRAAGYSAVHVITPEQEITEGVITFKVIETMIGKVILSGNEHYDKANIRNALPALTEGFTPSARDLSANIRLANENPTRQLDVVLSVGEEENTVDARVNVQDSSPHKVFLTLDNTGNENTGMYRAGVGFQHNNLFNRDHAATFNYTTSPNHAKDVKQVSASYRIPLYSVGDSVDMMAAHSDTDAGTTSTISGPLTFSGKGNIYGIHYNHYLPRRGDYTSKIVGGFDYREYLNNCLIQNTPNCGGGGEDLTLHPVSLAYSGALSKPTYVADFSAAVARNLPGGSRGGTETFNLVHFGPLVAGGTVAAGSGAKADYTLLRLNGSLSGILPGNWQYRMAGSSQYTRDALVSYEKTGLTGANTVRGFLEREASSDKGYVLNFELYSHDMAQDLKMQSGSLRLLWFIDRAQGWDEAIAGKQTANRISVGSAGVGLRFSYGKNLTAKLDYASVNQAGAGTGARAGDKRGHLSIVGSW